MRFNKKLGLISLLGGVFFAAPLSHEEVRASAELQVEDEEAEENLELPNIHENTRIYNGTINPELSLNVRMPGFEDEEDPSDSIDDIFVNDNGQFVVTFITDELIAGEEITFLLDEEAHEANQQTMEILPAEEGMEIVESNADTSEIENSIIDATEFEWQEQEQAILLDIETVGDIDSAPYYTVNDEVINDEKRAEHIQEDLYRATFSTESLNIGDVITVYVVASGVTAPVEVEVPDSLTVLQDESGEASIDDEDSEEPNDEQQDRESEDPNEEDDESVDGDEDELDTDNDDDTDVDEIDSDSEDTEDEGQGISTGWIITGSVVGLIIIVGFVFAIFKRK